MATEREKEREAELESTMYTNCLLLGLDVATLSNGTNDSARFGHFRHSNPRMGEQLLYFLVSALRGPVQSAKDFDKVWPIIDSAQSKDFGKVEIVQGIIVSCSRKGRCLGVILGFLLLLRVLGEVAAVPEDVGTTGVLRAVAHHLTANDVLLHMYMEIGLPGISVYLETGFGEQLSSPTKKYIQNLLKANMEGPYGSEWPTEEKVKRRNMVAPEARYIFVRESPNSSSKLNAVKTNDEGNSTQWMGDGDRAVGFVHYRFIVEEDIPVIYVYELQLENCAQGKGLGKFLMQLNRAHCS